jgi:hypothetical protein
MLIRECSNRVVGCIGLGTIKTTITVDEDVWKKFTVLVIENYGYRKKNQVVERLIKEYIREHEWPRTFDAIWAFEEDILELRKAFKERIILAHLSQPLGKPLHRYVGQIIMEEDALLLSGKDAKTGAPSETFIPRGKIQELFLGWDDILRRWKDTRALIRPLRVRFEDHGKRRTLYIYAKKPEGMVYGRENKTLYEKLKTAWGIKSPENRA